MRRNLFLSLLISALVMLSGGLLLSGPFKTIEANAAGGPGGLPAIVATSNFGASDPKGTLKIMEVPLALDGKTYSNAIQLTSRTVMFSITPDDHYEVKSVTVRRGTFDGTTFSAVATVDLIDGEYKFLLNTVPDPSGTCPDTPEDCTDDQCPVHNPPYVLDLTADYRIEIEFELIEYTLQITAEYFKNPGKDASSLQQNFKAYALDNKGDINTAVTVSKVSLGDTVAFVNSRIGNANVRFCYAEMGGWYNLELETGSQYTGTYIINFGTQLLKEHAASKNISVTAIYIETYQVTVAPNIASSSHVDTLKVHTESPVTFTKGGFYTVFDGPISSEWLDKGTEISVVLERNDYYKVSSHNEANFPYVINEGTVTASRTITVHFEPRPFTLRVRVVDSNNNTMADEIDWAANITRDLVASDNLTSVLIGDKLNSITFAEKDGYVFKGFSIQRALGNVRDTLDFANPLTINEQYLQLYHRNNGLDITAMFYKQALLEVKLLDAKGSVKVYELDENDDFIGEVEKGANGRYTLELGARIRVVAISSLPNIFVLDQFTNVATSGINGNAVTFTMHDSASITVLFTSNPLSVTEKNPNSSIEYSEGEIYSIGQSVVFTYATPANHYIKGWKLNTKEVSTFNKDVLLSGNTLTVWLTAELLAANPTWFDVDGDLVSVFLDHEVDTAVKPEVLLAILIPSIFLPIAIIILGALFLVNFKRQKLIKVQLQGEMDIRKKFNPTAFIQDLREGKGGAITKEDVKKELKRQKEEAKSKSKEADKKKENAGNAPKVSFPTAPSPASVAKATPVSASAPSPTPTAAPTPAAVPETAPVPASPAPTAAPETKVVSVSSLNGAQIMADRTIVSADKSVIAHLDKDGKITDLSGRLIAKANPEDGTIVGIEGGVIGIVQGTGVITLQN